MRVARDFCRFSRSRSAPAEPRTDVATPLPVPPAPSATCSASVSASSSSADSAAASASAVPTRWSAASRQALQRRQRRRGSPARRHAGRGRRCRGPVGGTGRRVPARPPPPTPPSPASSPSRSSTPRDRVGRRRAQRDQPAPRPDRHRDVVGMQRRRAEQEHGARRAAPRPPSAARSTPARSAGRRPRSPRPASGPSAGGARPGPRPPASRRRRSTAPPAPRSGRRDGCGRAPCGSASTRRSRVGVALALQRGRERARRDRSARPGGPVNSHAWVIAPAGAAAAGGDVRAARRPRLQDRRRLVLADEPSPDRHGARPPATSSGRAATRRSVCEPASSGRGVSRSRSAATSSANAASTQLPAGWRSAATRTSRPSSRSARAGDQPTFGKTVQPARHRARR